MTTSINPKNFEGKRRVARQLIHQAIVSIFNDDNPLAIHLMAQALEASLSDLFRAAQRVDPFLSLIKSDRKREMISLMRKSANFIKHADNDPLEQMDGRDIVGMNDALVSAACFRYATLFGERTEHMILFGYYMAVLKPKTMTAMPLDRAKQIYDALNGDMTRGALLALMANTCRLTPEIAAERAADLTDLTKANQIELERN
jgi:stress-induced morphogen